MVVVLPAPFGPSSPNTSPSLILRSRIDQPPVSVLLGQALGDNGRGHRLPPAVAAEHPGETAEGEDDHRHPTSPHKGEVLTVILNSSSSVASVSGTEALTVSR